MADTGQTSTLLDRYECGPIRLAGNNNAFYDRQLLFDNAIDFAKLVITFINNLAGTIDGDPTVAGRLKVGFLPEPCVSLTERLIPTSDVSDQILAEGEL